MKSSSRSAERFVDAVYRRWVIVRAAEQIGRGMLLASLLASGLLLLGAWQAIPTGPILLFCGIFGLFLGGILALYRRPTRLAAAVEADRQLRFDDLLTTAIYPADRSDPDFRAMVIRMADARCSSHSPSDVFLRHFGVRGWGGIAFAMSVAAMLAAIPFEPSRSQAVDANASVLSASPGDVAQTSRMDRGSVAVVSDPMSDGASSGAMSAKTTAGNDTQGAQARGAPGTGSTAGAGGGSASTAGKPGQSLQSGQSSGRSSSPGGITAGGGTTSDQQVGHGDSAAGAIGALPKSKNAVPGWSGNSIANSPNTGRSTIDRVPSEDRDLVRDFFQQ